MTNDTFQFCEKDLAAQMGIPRATLKEIRDTQMTKGEHWDMVSMRICLSRAGVDLAATFVGLLDSEKDPRLLLDPDDTETVQADPPDHNQHLMLPASSSSGNVRIGKVSRITKNTRIILVESLGETVRMRVRHNGKFLPGMEVPMKLIEEPDLYELARKAPRWRGKW